MNTNLSPQSKSNFSLAFVGLKKNQRHALQALYAYCREIDDIVDEAKNPVEAQKVLNHWREMLDRLSTPSIFDPSIAHNLAWAVKEFSIEVDDLRWILTGVEMDLKKTRYQKFDELLEYCDGVASAVGYATMAILGADRNKTSTYTLNTGRALQLTNILRDVRKDASIGRIYLPQEDLARYRVTDREILRGAYSPAFFQLMEFEAKRVEKLYEDADMALNKEDKRKYAAAEVMRSTYHALLTKIQNKEFRVMSSNIRLSKPRKLMIALSVWAPHLIWRTFRTGNA